MKNIDFEIRLTKARIVGLHRLYKWAKNTFGIGFDKYHVDKTIGNDIIKFRKKLMELNAKQTALPKNEKIEWKF